MKRPHIVLYLSDDHGAEFAGCYGNADVHTPHLDALSDEGMRFERMFTTTPTCAPSRSTLYTGLYPQRHGAMRNHTACRGDLTALPTRMRRLGYRTALAGKKHASPDALFDFEKAGGFTPRRPEQPRKYRSEGLDVEAAERFMEKSLEERPDEPLFIVLGDPSPHVTWEKRRRFDPERLTLPPYFVDTPMTRRALANYYQDIETLDGRVGRIMGAMERLGIADDALFIYTTDHGSEWYRSKWTLYDAGIRVPFIARWPGRIEAGSVSNAMVSFVDMLPTFMEIAGGEPDADLDGASFLEALLGRRQGFREKIYATHTGDGKMNATPQRCVRDGRHKYLLNLNPGRAFTSHFTEVEGLEESHGDIWKTWVEKAKTDAGAAALVEKATRRPKEELYDLEADPFELNNLADLPEHQKRLETMRADLQAWMDETADPGMDV